MSDLLCCSLRFRAVLFLSALLLVGGGCAGAAGIGEIPKADFTDDSLDSIMERIGSDPLSFLKQSLAETRTLKTFRMTFERQSRLGLFKTLKPAERMVAEFREDPFSVHFSWISEGSEYAQCVYVEGKNKNRVALLPRSGFLGGKPAVSNYPIHFAVMFHKARNPITDFGPRRMMERTLDRIEKAQSLGDVSIELMGAKKVGPDEEPCFHIKVVYPPADEFPSKLHDLYISTRTHLPMATYLWLSTTDERTPETLDARYVYSHLEPNIALTDADFVLAERQKDIGLGENEAAAPADYDTETTAAK